MQSCNFGRRGLGVLTLIKPNQSLHQKNCEQLRDHRPPTLVDSGGLARDNRRALEIRHEVAESRERSALVAIDPGEYLTDHRSVKWSGAVKAAEAANVSIPPDVTLPQSDKLSLDQTLMSAVNRTTLAAAGDGRRRASSART